MSDHATGKNIRGKKQFKSMKVRGMKQLKTLKPRGMSQFMTQPSSRPAQKRFEVKPNFRQIKTQNEDDITRRIRIATSK